MRTMFSQALDNHPLRQGENRRVRPNGNPSDTLANEGVGHSEDQEEGEIIEEGRQIKGQKIIYQPSKQEYDDHQRTHIPFRKWCPHCVRGKCTSGAHRRTHKTEEELEKETPVISWDYMGPKSKDLKSSCIDALSIIVGTDRKSK